jgi:hypothetical protein
MRSILAEAIGAKMRHTSSESRPNQSCLDAPQYAPLDECLGITRTEHLQIANCPAGESRLALHMELDGGGGTYTRVLRDQSDQIARHRRAGQFVREVAEPTTSPIR